MATASDITGGMTSLFRGLASTVRTVGVAMTALSAVAGAAMFSLATSAEKVNEKFREIDTISSQVSNTQSEYGDLVSELNTKMGLQANRLDVLQGLYKSISAGVQEGEEAQREFLTTASELAVVGRVDLATTVDILSTSVNAYGEDTEFANRASNALFRTVQFGKTTMEELAPVMGRVTALGSGMNVAIEELGASMAVLTRTGFESRIAATGLRAVLRGLMRPSEDMEQLLRDIALANDLFAESMGENSDQIRQVAEDYKSATDAIKEYEAAQESARNTIEESNLAIQRTRLAIQAIEENRIDQLEDVKTAELARENSIEQLNSRIEEYRFQINQARVKEEEARQSKDDMKEQVAQARQEFKQALGSAGDLQGAIGQLVVENEGLIETLTQIKERADENNISMGDLFNRTRGLQAALALVGKDGELLNEIFAKMQTDAQLTEQDMAKLQERFDITKQEIEEARKGITAISDEYRETVGPAQELRNAKSQLGEAAADLGQLFIGPLTDAIQGITNWIDKLIDRVNAMNEATKNSIGRFAVLATSIGLVLGPLLLFGGQIALIASSMGSAFLPIVLVLGSALGILGSGFVSAKEGGSEAQDTLSSMRGILMGIIDSVIFLKNIFVEETVPGMIVAGEGIIAVFSEVFGELSDGTGESDSLLRQFAALFGAIFRSIGNILKNNAEAIAQFVAVVVDGFLNKVIPAVAFLGQVFFNDVFPVIVSFIQSQVIPVLQKFGMMAQRIFVNRILPALVSLGNTFINDILPKIVQFVKTQVIPVLQQFARIFVNQIVPFIKSQVIPALIQLGKGFADVGIAIIQAVQSKEFQSTLNTIVQVVQKAIKALVKIIGILGRFFSENKGAIKSFIQFAIELGKILVEEVAPALKEIIDTIVLVVGALAVLTTAVIKVLEGSKAFSIFVNVFRETFEATLEIVVGTIRVIVNSIRAIILAFQVVIAFFTGGDVEGAAKKFFSALKSIGQGFVQFLEGLGRMTIAALSAIPRIVVGIFIDVAKGIVAVIKSLVNTLVGNSIIPDLVADIVWWFATLPLKIVQALISNVQKLYNWFKNDFTDTITSGFSDIVNWFTKLPGKIKNKLTSVDWSKAIKEIVNGFAGVVLDVATFFSSLPSKIVTALADVDWSNAKDEITDGFSGIVGTVASGFGKLASKISDALPDSLGDAVQGLKDFGGKLAGKIGDGISGTIDVIGTLLDSVKDIGSDLVNYGEELAGKIKEGIKEVMNDFNPLNHTDDDETVGDQMSDETDMDEDEGAIFDWAAGAGSWGPNQEDVSSIVSSSSSSSESSSSGSAPENVTVNTETTVENAQDLDEEEVAEEVAEKNKEEILRLLRDAGVRLETR